MKHMVDIYMAYMSMYIIYVMKHIIVSTYIFDCKSQYFRRE